MSSGLHLFLMEQRSRRSFLPFMLPYMSFVIFPLLLSHFSLYFQLSVVWLWCCLAIIFFILNLLGVFWTFNICKFMYFTKFGKFGVIISPDIFLPHSLFFSWTSIKYIYAPLDIIYNSLRLCLFVFILFFSLRPSDWIISIDLFSMFPDSCTDLQF